MKLLKGTKNILLLQTSRGKWLRLSEIFADRRRVNRITEVIRKYGEASLICSSSCGDENGDIKIGLFYRKSMELFDILRICQVADAQDGKWECSWRGLTWTLEDAEMLAKYGVAI